jgi:undecaprenyl-diphosphatase
MSLLQALILGITQGLTEFIPVSSSAHLVLLPWVLGWRFDPQAAFLFDVLVQLGTLLAVVIYFWADLIDLASAALRGMMARHPFSDPKARLAWLLLLASLPAAALGLALKNLVEQAFSSPMAASAFLVVTAGMLWGGERLGKRLRPMEDLSTWDALWIGLAQALALFPGISRSGSTIAAGLTRGLKRDDAARFAFLMSIPIMIGAGLVALRDLIGAPALGTMTLPLLVGFISAALAGFLAIHWLLGYLRRRPLTAFAIYCAVIGVSGVVAGLIRG